MKNPVLYIVVPCFNEEKVLPETAKRLSAIIMSLVSSESISNKSRILFVDDGSFDSTWNIILDLNGKSSVFTGIKLAHNSGHQNALWAGMMQARDRCDILISMDADLQDDPNALKSFIEEYKKGADIVYGVRSKRRQDTFFKRNAARLYYRLLHHMGADIIADHADYRLLSRRAIDALSQFSETNLFLRGMIPQLGFKTAKVYYERSERFAGESKYPLKKQMALAVEGITSFSIKPIRFVFAAGIICALFGIIIAIYALIQKAASSTVKGWTSIIVSMWIIGGVVLIGLGIIGEYIGKIYMEVKRRPRYIIDTSLIDDRNGDDDR